MRKILLLLFVCLSRLLAVENLTPAQVHDRLVAGDSLLLLDVREISEYQSRHIAEPPGQVILTPANMPWGSGLLGANYRLLPADIDIIVYCQSGSRSAAASAYLQSVGFTRLFNMTGGFSRWTFESRPGAFGDHSGGWIETAENFITCPEQPAQIYFAANSNRGAAFYVELHQVNLPDAPFVGLPDSSQLYSTTALDQFGLSLFKNDTLALANNAEYFFTQAGETATCRIHMPDQGWRDVEAHTRAGKTAVATNTLYKWLLFLPGATTRVMEIPPQEINLVRAYPNPFNGAIKIDAPAPAKISIYDTLGKYVTRLETAVWQPSAEIVSGVYFVRVEWQEQVVYQKVLYNK